MEADVNTKRCPGCERDLPYTQEYWVRNAHRLSGLGDSCKRCKILYSRRWRRGLVVRSTNPPWRPKTREWRCAVCKVTKPLTDEFFPRSKNRPSGFGPRCRPCSNKKAMVLQWKLKLEMIAAYGGRCSCCGETEPRFLTLEHLEHDGQEHRKQKRCGGFGTWRDLKRRGWPKDKYTIYCWNCNLATRLGDPCPHKIKAQFRSVQP